MRKLIYIGIAGLLFASCASGWKCNKRYCDASAKPVDKIKEV